MFLSLREIVKLLCEVSSKVFPRFLESWSLAPYPGTGEIFKTLF